MAPVDIRKKMNLQEGFQHELGRDTEKPQFIIYYQDNPDFKEKDIFEMDKYTLLLAIRAWDHEEVFHTMQGEVWSPKGEARKLISFLGLHHTSMCVGDVIRDCERQAYYMVCGNGFKEVNAYWEGDRV